MLKRYLVYAVGGIVLGVAMSFVARATGST